MLRYCTLICGFLEVQEQGNTNHKGKFEANMTLCEFYLCLSAVECFHSVTLQIRDHFHDLLKFLFTETNFASVVDHKLYRKMRQLVSLKSKVCELCIIHLLLNKTDFVNF